MSIRLLGITALALALGCSGARKSIKRADAYMVDGRPEAAARTYTKVLERHPRDPKLLVSVAKAWLAAGEPERALPPAELAVHADGAGSHAVLAASLISLGRAEEGKPHVQKAIEQNPDDGATRLLLAEALLAMGDVVGAVSVVEDALPKATEPRHRTFAAWIHSRAGNHERAQTLARRATLADLDDAQIYAEAAAVHRAARDAEAARTAAGRARTAMRDQQKAWEADAARRDSAGDREGALRRMSWLRAVYPEDGWYALQLGEFWSARGEPERALDELAGARELEPFSKLLANSAGVQVDNTSTLSMSQAERTQAIIRLHLGEAEAHRLRGNTRASLASHQEALVLTGERASAEAWRQIAEGWGSLAMHDQAIAAAELALTRAPRDLVSHVVIVRSHAALGRVDKAIGYGRLAWDIAPGEAELALLLSQLYVHRGDLREAQKILAYAIQENPDDPRLPAALERAVQGG